MIIDRPATATRQPDGIYLGMVSQAIQTKSRINGGAQIEITITLNSRQKTRVWVNQTSKGIQTLLDTGIAIERDDGKIEIRESNHLVGVVVQRGKGLLVPASAVVKMNPSLEPLFNQVALRASFK